MLWELAQAKRAADDAADALERAKRSRDRDRRAKLAADRLAAARRRAAEDAAAAFRDAAAPPPAPEAEPEAEPEPERPLLASQSEPTFQAYVENLPERRKPPRRSKAALAPFPKPENAALPPPKKRPTRFKSVDEWAPKA